MTIDHLFQQLRFVLVDTSHPGNVGAAARAIKTMGFGQLYLVNPRYEDVLSHPDAIAFASGAQDVLERAQVVKTIEEALIGCQLVAAVSARLREFSPPVIDGREFGQRLIADQQHKAALVFGSERYGLPNQIVIDSHVLINIPTDATYSSLNLAQAIQILAYEARLAIMSMKGESAGIAAEINIGFRGDSATTEQIDGMYVHLQEALTHIGFLDADNPKKLMPRLKRMFSRTQLEVEEVNIIRGIARKIMSLKN